MTLEDAKREARKEARAYNTRITVVHDPMGREDWETEDEAYGYAPAATLGILYRHATVICVVTGD